MKLEMMPMGEAASWTCHGRVTIAPHCLGPTHLDALGHVYLHGHMYNGRWATDHVTDAGPSVRRRKSTLRRTIYPGSCSTSAPFAVCNGYSRGRRSTPLTWTPVNGWRA